MYGSRRLGIIQSPYQVLRLGLCGHGHRLRGEGRPERDGLPQRVGRTAIELVWKGQRIGDIVVMLRDELWPDE